MRISVMGCGTVGKAVAAGSRGCEVSMVDKYKPELCRNTEIFAYCKICFVCCPTPLCDEGLDYTEVQAALEALRRIRFKGVVAIKSTVLPGTMAKLQAMFSRLRLVHNPEFLTARSANKDFATQTDVLLTGDLGNCIEVKKYYDKILDAPQMYMSTDYRVSEWAKIVHNVTLPVKISLLNEIHALIGDQQLFDRAIRFAKPFGNVGENSSVPGPDGKMGWGGPCFKKDTQALFNFSKGQLKILGTAIQSNKLARPEID